MQAKQPVILTPYDIEAKVESYHWWFVVRRKLLKSLLSYIDLPYSFAVVDIGCGTGSNLDTLKSLGLNVIGFDQSFYALSLTKNRIKCPLFNGDLNKLPIRSESLGLIVAMDILEHLDNDISGIQSFYRSLKENGVLILTVPAFRPLGGIQDKVTGHKRRYLKQEIVKKLQQEGFRIVKSSYFNFFLFFPILLARRLINLFELRIDSENEINSPMINFFLKSIFSIEPFILKFFSFPFGVSIFCIAKKVRFLDEN
jgi:SAM-dependent methyltransferase